MIRLYIDTLFQAGAELKIPAEEFNYFKKARRAQGEVLLFNRMGQEATGKFARERVFLIEAVRTNPSPTYDLTLALALPESNILPDLVRSLSEIGLRRLVLFRAERSQYPAKKLEAAHPRLEKIAIESQRQCARPQPLEIEIDVKWQRFTSEVERIWFFDESSSKSPVAVENPKKVSKALVIVGCEGGWTSKEHDEAEAAGVEFVHLKTPILRVATAATVAAFFGVERMNTMRQDKMDG